MTNKTNNITQDKITDQISGLNNRIHELENLLSQKNKDIENLKKRELTYHDIIDNMEIGYAHYKIIIQDEKPSDFIFLEVNETFEKIMGINRDIIVGNRISEVFPGIENDLQDWIQIFGDVALNRRSTTLEQYSAALKKWFSICVFSPSKGQFVTLFCDITKQMEEKNVFEKQATIGKIRSRRLENILNYTGIGIYSLNNNEKVTHVNPAAAKMLGYKVDELMGRKIESLLLQGEVSGHKVKKMFQRRDGTEFPVELVIEAIGDNQNEILGHVIAFLDISKTEDASVSETRFNALLAASEARFKNLFTKMEEEIQKGEKLAQMYLDIVGVTIIALDALGRVTLINRKGCDTIKYEEEEIIGKNWFDTVIPEDMRTYEKELFESLMGGEIDEIDIGENIILTKNGEERVISWRNMIIEDENEKIIGALSSGMDITGLKRSEKELKQILASFYST
ncbi:MAG: PAS domain-containing protein [Candidatus Heimdallarchaeota archaeon]|nr:MAG: PAS domain-containing protein [Candidatus Heimdallarchaeota archaeon]